MKRHLVRQCLRVALLAGSIALGCAIAAEPRVYRDRIRPHWFADGNKFWYRVETGRGSWEYVLVDAVQGRRTPGFDHARLAKALSDAGVPDVRPERLALEVLEFEPSGEVVTFRAGNRGWRCDLRSYELAEATVQPPPGANLLRSQRPPRASSRTGEETSISFENRTPGEVRLFWLDPDGRRQPYGRLAANETRDQHTYSGHVWLLVDAQEREVGLFEATDDHLAAAISNEPAAEAREPAPPPKRGRRARSESNRSPDGRWQVALTNGNVLLRELATGQEIPLTEDASAKDGYSGRFEWSPDSTRFVAMRTQKGEGRKIHLIESSPSDQVQPKLHEVEYAKPGDAIDVSKPRLFEVAARREIPLSDALFPTPWSIDDVRWAADSSSFTFVYNQRGHQVLRLLEANATSGKVRVLVEERSPTFIDYAGKFFIEYLDDSGEILWMSERDGWNHLWLYDRAIGTVKNQVTRGPWVVRGVDRVDRETRQVWFRAGGLHPGQDPYFVHHARVNFDGTGLVILTEADGTHQAQFSPDHRFLIDRWSRVDHPPVHELRRTADGLSLCTLESADTSELHAARTPMPTPFTAPGRDGTTDIFGIIHWPRDCDRSKKYPVIESIYAGPQGAFVPKAFRSGNSDQQQLANLGFIVVQVDGMGTSHRSKAFHDVCWKNLGDSGFPDRIAWIRAAAAKHGCFDLSRVGIYGTSAGGQSALGALLTHGDFYRAAVADSGCHDNRMDKIWWNELWMGWPIGPHYAEQSNVTQAHRLQGKLLLMAGELDRNVDPASTLQVANALIKAGKDFEFLLVPGGGHGILGTDYGKRRLREFFSRHLLETRALGVPGQHAFRGE